MNPLVFWLKRIWRRAFLLTECCNAPIIDEPFGSMSYCGKCHHDVDYWGEQKSVTT